MNDSPRFRYECPNGHKTTLELTLEQIKGSRHKIHPEEVLCGFCGQYAPLTEFEQALWNMETSARKVREFVGVFK